MQTTIWSILTLMLMAGVARAELKTENVEYKDGDVVLQGYLAYDDKIDGKKPGILVVHEWWGLNDYAKGRAEQLAKLGYVAFALDMYGKGVVAKDPQEAGKLAGAVKGNPELMRRRAALALSLLKSNTRVDPTKTAIMGYCFGGTVALELARSGADIAGAVSFHGDLATQKPADASTLKAKLLICHGADDPFVKPEEVLDFAQEMNSAMADYQIIVYSGAVHGFTNPNAGKAGLNGVAYNAKADKRSWEAMKQFYAEIFGPVEK